MAHMQPLAVIMRPGKPGSWLLLAGACAFMAWLHLDWFPIGLPMLPLTGLAMAGLLVLGPQRWHAVFVGLIVGIYLRNPPLPLAGAVATVIATSATALAGAWAIARLRLSRPDQMSTREIAVVVAVCVGLLPLHQFLRVALLAVMGDALPGPLNIFQSGVRTGLGLLLWVSLAMSWLMQPIRWPRWKVALHFCLVMGLVAVSAALAYVSPYGQTMAWSIMPPLIWVALAFGTRGTTAAMMAIAGFAMYGASKRLDGLHGAAVMQDWAGQASLIVLASTTLLLGRLANRSRLSATLEVTARRLRAREAQLQLFIKESPAAIAMFDCDMRYLAHSERFLSVFRLEALGSVVGRSHYELFPELSERVRRIHQRVLEGEEASGEEDQFEMAPGCFEYFRWKLKPWRNDSGAIGGLILFCEVITQAVEALRSAEVDKARYRAVFDQTQVGITRSTLQRKFFDVNEPAAAMVGLTRGEMLTLGAQDITHPDDWPLVSAAG
jgi:PAS domain S-box-containing protein